MFVVFSHAHHAAVTDGPCKDERTHPGHTDDGMLHRLRDLPKTSAAGATTHHVWEVQALPRGVMTDEVSDLLDAQYRLSLLQWNAGTARRQPTQLVTAMCGAFNVVLLQEAADHVPHFPISSTHTRTGTTWPSCSTRTRSYRMQTSTRLLKNPRVRKRGALRLWLFADTYADHRLVLPKRSRSAQSICTT